LFLDLDIRLSIVLSGLKWRSSDEVAQGLARLFNLVAQEGRVVPSDLAAGVIENAGRGGGRHVR